MGYALAALAVPSALNGHMGIHTEGTTFGAALVLIIPVTVLAIPIFDTTLVTISRTLRRESAFRGGRDHSSHRLVVLGIEEKRAVWLLYGLAMTGGAVASLLQRFPSVSIPVFGMFAVLVVLSGVYLGHVKLQYINPDQIRPGWTLLVSKLRYKRHAVELLLDMVVIISAFMAAYLIRFDGFLTSTTQHAIVRSLPIVVPSCLVTFAFVGIYRGQWRQFSVIDLPRYLLAVGGGTLLGLALVTLMTRFGPGHSRSAYLIFGLLLLFAMMATRLSYRLLDMLVYRLNLNSDATRGTQVLIYGAGNAGKALYELMIYKPDLVKNDSAGENEDRFIVGFIDDDPEKEDRRLCGLPVRSPKSWLQRLRDPVPEIWISSPQIGDDRALDMSQRWNGEAKVQRLNVQMTRVESAAPTQVRTGVDP